QRLDLIDTQVQSVSPEVLSTYDARQILAALKGLALAEAKVVVLGEPNVGKTWLCERFFHGRIPQTRRETHDFELIVPDWRPRVGDLPVGLRVWDFGGQHILHGTHEMFLTQRSVCLLVVDVTQVAGVDSQVADPDRDGNRLAYWLKMIKHSIGPDAQVIVVITQCDRPQHQHQLVVLD